MSKLDRDNMVLNGKKIEVTDEEYDAAVKFHLGRRIFIWPPSETYKLVINEPNDERDHYQWSREDLGISDLGFEFSPRGYMDPNGIYIYIGFGHCEIEGWRLDQMNLYSSFKKLAQVHRQTYGPKDLIPVYNGVVMGKIGEQWPPKTLLCYLSTREEQNG